MLGLAQGVDVAYDLEALRLEARYCRCHLPPRTIMRAPGMVQAAMVMEQVGAVCVRGRGLWLHGSEDVMHWVSGCSCCSGWCAMQHWLQSQVGLAGLSQCLCPMCFR